MKKFLFLFLLPLLLISCEEDYRPKPKGFLALEYPEHKYLEAKISCPFQFEKNVIANIVKADNNHHCWLNLNYELLNGTIFLTYQPIENNLDSLLMDAQKLPLRHTIKADVIEGDIYTNNLHNTYGMFYEVGGNAASQAQFYLTDSTEHFVTGSIYFDAVPNFDSIYPAASYLKEDMRYLMESLRWK